MSESGEGARSSLDDSIADGREHRLDPNVLTAWRIGGTISAAILSGGSLIAAIVILFKTAPSRTVGLIALIAWLLFAAALTAHALLWPAVRYRHTTYRLDGTGLYIRRGVFWRSELSVPRSRVQHTDVSRGPIERALGLAALIVHTAGTQAASVSLSGLSGDAAYRIRDYLIEGGDGDAV